MAHGSAHGLFSPADADKAKQAAEDRLAMLLGQATCLEGLTIHPATIQATSVWRGVNAYVDAHGVDLIVMATHKNGILERIFGTKADGIMHHATVPVLSMPPKG